MTPLRPAALLLFISAALSAQSVQTVQTAPHQPCASLRSIQIPASAIALPTRGAHITSAKPEHKNATPFCRVLGEITSVDPTAQPIRFELNLPEQWNGKAVHYGGGGFNGSLKYANGLGTPEVGIHTDPVPLERGYATFGSDSGHHHHYLLLPDLANALRADFAANPEQRLNFAHDALKKVHDSVLSLLTSYYGTPPTRMFFVGGSTGGREAYFLTQLWPTDYDGVLGAYAGWNQVQLDLQFIRIAQAEYRPGDRFTRGWLPTSKTRLVASHVLAACDQLDGVQDGILSNPQACHFDLKTLACPSGTDHKNCLTPGQLQTFETFATEQRSAVPLANGVQSIPGYNITAGTDLTGSMGLLRHPFHNPIFLLNSFYLVVADGVLRFFLTDDPNYDALAFDTHTGGTYADRLLPQSIASDASNANLTPFFLHGGKFLMLHGTTDATIPTNSSVEFYQMLQAHTPQSLLNHDARFFLIPGYGHARGVFNAGFDALGILDRWTQTGIPPENLIVTDNNKSRNHRTRPLCAWPLYPRYTAGDPNQASSFACTAP
jgi:acetyl esterase/lipase